MRPLLASLSSLGLGLALTACGGGEALGPREVLSAYATAVEQGDAEAAYALLSAEARATLSFTDFAKMLRDHPEELRALASALRRPSGDALVRASLTAANGETLELVMEDGRWRLEAEALDLYGQSTPLAAVRTFIRAVAHQRWDVLLKLVPEEQAEGLDAEKLRASWEGEQRRDLEQLVQALQAALPTAEVELLGDRATLSYGATGTVELLRESGRWKIEDFK